MGERAGFVKHGIGDLGEVFQGLAAGGEDAAAGEPVCGSGEGSGRGEGKGAGTGDDEQRYGCP